MTTEPTLHSPVDIRCKGTKSDYDLVTEYMELDKVACGDTRTFERLTKKQMAIQEEIGKERLELLVFMRRTEERLEEFERKIRHLYVEDGYIIRSGGDWYKPVKQAWYKRLFSL